MKNDPLVNDPRLLIGTSWYPEMWPESEWPRDLARMRELGFGIVRMFEFAWHRFEPRENHFDLAWAQRVLDLCHQHGIVVMAGTPTAAPPAWISYGYPECLRVAPDGRRAQHGGRQHGSCYSQRYRDFSARIVEKMAEAFRGHPALHSWQIDNEISGYDWSSEARAGLHAFLRQRYGDIATLNRAWGLEFWSQAYESFEQIPMPEAVLTGSEAPARQHPSLALAAAEYHSQVWADYIRMQADIIRRVCGNHLPITTNMLAGFGLDWYRINRSLDRIGFSMYRDLDHYYWNLMNFERMRCEKLPLADEHAADAARVPYRPYWLLETAPSWSAGGRVWNIHNSPAGVKLMTWTSTLLGGSMTLYWQWRSHWAGQEMQHGTLVTATGEWSVNKEAMQQLSAEHAANSDWLLTHPPQRAKLGIMLSVKNAWGLSLDPIDPSISCLEHWREAYYMPLVRQHLWRDVITDDHDLSGYRLLILPLMPIITPALRARLKTFVEAGGLLLLGPIVGYRTAEFTAFTDRTFGGLEELIGGTSALRFTTMWVNDQVKLEYTKDAATLVGTSLGDAPPAYRNAAEAFTPQAGTQVLAHYRGGYGDGLPALLHHPLGRGAVVTLGCAVSADAYLALVEALARRAGIAPLAEGSPNVVVVPRADAAGNIAGYGLLNLAKSPQEITVAGAPHALAPLETRLVRDRSPART